MPKADFVKQCHKCYALFDYGNGICPICNHDHEAEKQTINKHRLTFKSACELIKDAFETFYEYADGTVKQYTYFGFRDHFNILFCEARKLIQTEILQNQILDLHSKLCNIYNVYNQSIQLKNCAAKSKAFEDDLNEALSLMGREEEFIEFGLPSEFNQPPLTLSSKDLVPSKKRGPKKLPHPVIALIYYYLFIHDKSFIINVDNADTIAKKFGQSSGATLLKQWAKVGDKKWRLSVSTDDWVRTQDRKLRLERVRLHLPTLKLDDKLRGKALKEADREYDVFLKDFNIAMQVARN